MDGTFSLEDFIRTYGAMERPSFVAAFTHPFLLVDLSGASEKLRGTSTCAPEATSVGAKELEATNVQPSSLWILPIQKSPRNVAADRIPLGRITDCDLVIPHGSVSKVHAFFKKHPSADRYTIIDAGSSFGTTVNGKVVDAKNGLPLRSGNAIVFAKVVPSTFFFANDLYDFIRIVIRTQKNRIL